MTETQVLMLMVAEAIRDDVIDVLIQARGISGFNMETIAGYSKEHSQYSLREQVEGFRELYKFEVMHTHEQEAALLAALRPVCRSAGVRYWIVPLLSQGHI